MSRPAHRVTIFGAGYIGLVAGACFAELGHHVTIRDIQPERVRILNSGEVPIYEPGLGDMLARNKERLSYTLDGDEAVRDADVAYICVDTPPTASGDADLSRVWAVIDTLGTAGHLKAVVVKSTVPVGTGERIRRALDEAGLGHVGYASNPEFTAEGRAITDFMRPDRIVIGATDTETADLVAALHDGIDGPVDVMDIASAEMVKMAANALLATKISFTNEIAALCEATGADITHVTRAIGQDHRLGPHFMNAGLGYGGSCFPKDSRALRALASNTGYPFQLLTAVIEVNELQPRRAVQRLKTQLGTLKGRTVTLLGMTFKPGTDDMREAPSTIIAARLLAEGAHVRCWDPMARPGPGAPWDTAERHPGISEALDHADAAVVVTEWPELRDTDWSAHVTRMQTPVIFDGRNVLDLTTMQALGYTYLSVGRASGPEHTA
ncbi:UDP-glucose/GDP-mannose dehydrogenase family protein [Streptomyces griseus]|uniref:UDP-glucose dehydrogenase family protein n=1 Tax=Streptomyces griseus TaxID=1911 RepID=UPI000566EED4|nr:UDP-glucose/GDP-mannose dehydrogenase family protein [Streptomyces griseus]